MPSTHTQNNTDTHDGADNQVHKGTGLEDEEEMSGNTTPTALESLDDNELMKSFIRIRKKEREMLSGYKHQLNTQKKEHEDEVKQMEDDFSAEIQQNKQIIKKKDREISNYKQSIEEKDRKIAKYKQTIEEKDREIAKYVDKQKLCHCYECGRDIESFIFCGKECKETHIR